MLKSIVKAPGYVRRVAWDDKDFKELHTKFASNPMLKSIGRLPVWGVYAARRSRRDAGG